MLPTTRKQLLDDLCASDMEIERLRRVLKVRTKERDDARAEVKTWRGVRDRNHHAMDLARLSPAQLRPDCNRIDHAVEDMATELERLGAQVETLGEAYDHAMLKAALTPPPAGELGEGAGTCPLSPCGACDGCPNRPDEQ